MPTIPAGNSSDGFFGYVWDVGVAQNGTAKITAETNAEAWVFDPGRTPCGILGNGSQAGDDYPLPFGSGGYEGALLVGIERQPSAEGFLNSDPTLDGGWKPFSEGMEIAGPVYRFWFRMNDNNVTDNSGAVNIRVLISQGSPHLSVASRGTILSALIRGKKEVKREVFILRGPQRDLRNVITGDKLRTTLLCGLLRWRENQGNQSIYDVVASGSITVVLFEDDGITVALTETIHCSAGQPIAVQIPHGFQCV